MSDENDVSLEAQTNMLDLFYNEDSSEPETAEVDVSEEDSAGTPEATDAIETDEAEAEAEVESEVNDETEGDDDSEELVYEIEGEQITLKELKELKEGGLRQSDYTKKTQALAEERKTLDAERQKFAELNEQLESSLKDLQSQMNTEEIDWDYLRETDTAEYIKQKELKEANEAKLKAASEQLKAQKKADFDAKVALNQSKLLESNPSWLDGDKLSTEGQEEIKLINSYFQDAEFTQEEMADVVNYKVMNAILKAAKFDKLKSGELANEKRTRKAPKVVKPSVKKAEKPSKPKTAAEVFYNKTA